MRFPRSVAGPMLLLVSCAGSGARPADLGAKSPPPRSATFAEDLAFLNAHGETIVLTSPEGAQIVVSPRYQGRVMTSSTSARGPSFGWINRSFIEAGKTGTQFDNFGGEDRFWLGPEGGQNGLYFPPGKPFTFDAWQTPQAMQEGAWTVTERATDRVVLKKSMKVTNWSGTELSVDVERTVRVLRRGDVDAALNVRSSDLDEHMSVVGFETTNRIVNAGKVAWTKEAGLVSIWILSMFAPSPDARVIIPFERNAPSGTPIVNDAYFGKVPPARLAVHEDKGYLSFKCDGKERGKIGLPPERARGLLGSYSAAAQLLTVVQYDGPKKGAPYVNSMWEQQKEPYKGDVINSYNDGPPAPGKPALGGFYEIETSSPAAELAPGAELVHAQRTFHFHGRGAEQLASQVLLGAGLTHLPSDD